jgi:hypothetical protein
MNFGCGVVEGVLSLSMGRSIDAVLTLALKAKMSMAAKVLWQCLCLWMNHTALI